MQSLSFRLVSEEAAESQNASGLTRFLHQMVDCAEVGYVRS